MLKADSYNITYNPDKHCAVLSFCTSDGTGPTVLHAMGVEGPEDLGKLSRLAAFFLLIDAEIYDRAALGDYESENYTAQDLQKQIEKMLADEDARVHLDQEEEAV